MHADPVCMQQSPLQRPWLIHACARNYWDGLPAVCCARCDGDCAGGERAVGPIPVRHRSEPLTHWHGWHQEPGLKLLFYAALFNAMFHFGRRTVESYVFACGVECSGRQPCHRVCLFVVWSVLKVRSCCSAGSHMLHELTASDSVSHEAVSKGMRSVDFYN